MGHSMGGEPIIYDEEKIPYNEYNPHDYDKLTEEEKEIFILGLSF